MLDMEITREAQSIAARHLIGAQVI